MLRRYVFHVPDREKRRQLVHLCESLEFARHVGDYINEDEDPNGVNAEVWQIEKCFVEVEPREIESDEMREERVYLRNEQRESRRRDEQRNRSDMRRLRRCR